VVTTKTGPDDTRRVVWAIGTRFFFLRVFYTYYLIIYIMFRYYLYVEGTKRVRVGGDDENGPRRHQTRRLGPRYVFFFLSRFFDTN
jgi:hypothetical protein